MWPAGDVRVGATPRVEPLLEDLAADRDAEIDGET